VSRPFELIETMRWDGGAVRLDRHLARLSASAHFFGIPLDVERVRSEVLATASQCEGSGSIWRLRLTVNAEGEPSVTRRMIEDLPEAPRRVIISPSRIDAHDVFRRHKTSRRELYDQEYESAMEQGWFEVLYANGEGLLAEGSRTNVFVESAGRLLTPPVADGALPGVYRSAVLESNPRAREARIAAVDLAAFDRILVCNAVIGLVEVELIDSLGLQAEK
jgi:para-aminobenzoate synthetase/4-amino-4-deoxychorismate lyase